jgi:hypothetical protein
MVWGHPLKGPCQEEKFLLSKKKGFLVSLAVVLPPSLPLPKLLSIFGVSLYPAIGGITHQD